METRFVHIFYVRDGRYYESTLAWIEVTKKDLDRSGYSLTKDGARRVEARLGLKHGLLDTGYVATRVESRMPRISLLDK